MLCPIQPDPDRDQLGPGCLDPSLPDRPSLTELLGLLSDLARGCESTDGLGAPLTAAIGVGYGPSPKLHVCLPPDPGRSLIDQLVGLGAPDSWRAAGIIASGAAWRYDVENNGCLDEGKRWHGGDESQVCVIHLMDRTGAHATQVTERSDHDFASEVIVGDDTQENDAMSFSPATSGRVLDVCRRMLGLSTDPPEGNPRTFWDTIWLDRMLVSVLGPESEPLDWCAAVSLHPATSARGLHPPDARLWARPVSVDTYFAPAALRERVGSLADAFDWEVLLEACTYGHWRTEALTAADADWMDAGIFSRWLNDHYPSPRDALADLKDLLDRPVFRQVVETLQLS